MPQLSEHPIKAPESFPQGERATKPLGCEVCSRLLNLLLTGEWVCPCCGGPSAEVRGLLRAGPRSGS